MDCYIMLARSAPRLLCLALPLSLACGVPDGMPPPAEQRDELFALGAAAAQGRCRETASSLLFVETFNRPLTGWRWFTTQPTDPGHAWAIVREGGQGVLASDPGGPTLPAYENRIDTPPLSLVGRTRGYVRFQTRFQHGGLFQVYMDDNVGRDLIADFGLRNPSWPAADCVEIPIPRGFIGQNAVRLSFVLAGGAGGGKGVEIDNLRVSVRACADSPDGDASTPPLRLPRRPFTITPCAPAN